jgi:hypothetical protein
MPVWFIILFVVFVLLSIANITLLFILRKKNGGTVGPQGPSTIGPQGPSIIGPQGPLTQANLNLVSVTPTEIASVWSVTTPIDVSVSQQTSALGDVFVTLSGHASITFSGTSTFSLFGFTLPYTAFSNIVLQEPGPNQEFNFLGTATSVSTLTDPLPVVGTLKTVVAAPTVTDTSGFELRWELSNSLVPLDSTWDVQFQVSYVA